MLWGRNAKASSGPWVVNRALPAFLAMPFQIRGLQMGYPVKWLGSFGSFKLYTEGYPSNVGLFFSRVPLFSDSLLWRLFGSTGFAKPRPELVAISKACRQQDASIPSGLGILCLEQLAISENPAADEGERREA